MALLLIEGFDSLSAINDAYYATSISQCTVETTITNSGRASMKIAGATTTSVPIPFGGTSNEIYFGFAFRINSLPGADMPIVTMCSAYFEYFDLVLTSGGVLKFKSFTTVRSPDSGANVLTTDTWYYIEVKVKKSNSISAGDVSLRVDGVEWIELDAASDVIYSIEFAYTDCLLFWGYTSKIVYIDDLYVCDETGAVNNTFLGPVKVATLNPTDNGASSDFTGSDADSTDNYAHVYDSAGQNDDVTYVESDTTDHIDLYDYDDMPADIGDIHGIDVVSVVKNDVMGGGTVRQGAPIVRSGGTNYQGDTYNVGSPYVHKHHILEEDPDTSTAWDEAGVEAAEFGVKVVA